MIFDRPEFLLLLPLVPAAGFFAYFRKERGAVTVSASVWKGRAPAPGKALFSKLMQEHEAEKGNAAAVKFRKGKQLKTFITDIMVIFSIMLVVFSLSGPSSAEKQVRYLEKGDEYFVLIDVSPSMGVMEGESTRLEAAKIAARTVSEIPGNDYPGLILFGSSAVVALFPSPDREEFRKRVESAEIMELGDATAMGAAIGTALYHLKGSSSQRKRIFLISDGGSNYGQLPPLDAAGIAAQLGIPVTCLAIGSPSVGESEITVTGSGGKTERRKVSGSYNPEILGQIADLSDGYFMENPGRHALSGIASLMKKPEEKTETVYVKKPLSAFFLYAGALMYMALIVCRKTIFKELIP